MMLKDKEGKWQPTQAETGRQTKIKKLKDTKGQATLKADIAQRCKELEELLGI
ncbi:hypothetical protein [Dehalobacter sp. 14DCB1]|uniref:hypothetical protein n=1 Tax=Dehalobacter sp. 14DCB1 TaxID=2070227 RepID=UPI0014054765|nr:hypothetical protein [Dehalobacter sp. 14DCB1]